MRIPSSLNRYLSLLFTFILAIFPLENASADQLVTYINTNYSGSAYLNSSTDLQIDITPLANNSDTWRYLNFAWSKNDQSRTYGAQIGFDVYSSGTQHNFVFSVYGAVDQQILTGVGNSVRCEKRNPYDISGKTYFQSVCFTPYKLAPGHTFRLRVYNNAALGPTWFNASFEDLTSNARLEVGSINMGDKNFLDPLQYVQYGMGGTDSNPDCSKVGINDTIISSVKSGKTSLTNLASQSVGSCLNAVIVPNKYPLGGNVVKFGGINPASRNLESGATLSSSTNSTTTTNTVKKTVVNKPSFSLINVVGNKLNVDVNIGSAGSSRPDSVYLVAPKLGVLDSDKLLGKVSGSKASWSIDFDKLLAGTSIPLKVVGVKNGVESDPLEQDFNAPATVNKLLTNNLVPATPKNVKTRIVGSSAIVTAEATVKSGSLATQAFIFGPSIGLSKAKAISGDIVGNKVLLEVPLKSSMAGKKLPVTIFLSNDVGDSQPVQTVITVPSTPKIPSGTIKIPTDTNAPKTIFCVKGSQTRTFAASKCPPGWKNA